MISIITAIYNQRAMNEIFYEHLVAKTKNPFELIILNNSSDDGSKEFFQNKENVKVIDTGGNYNYPYCQNLGIKHAKYDLLCFFNNDIIVSDAWDEKILEIMKSDDRLLILSPTTNDHTENKEEQKKNARRWRYIKESLIFLFGARKFSLKLMFYLMYWSFNDFNKKRFETWGYKTVEGYSGSSIIFDRSIIEKVGEWDERIQSADFDIFNRVKEYSMKNNDLLPIQMALGIYFHHYRKLSAKFKSPPLTNSNGMISNEEKWGEKMYALRKDIV